jgi:hypothetical protein
MLFLKKRNKWWLPALAVILGIYTGCATAPQQQPASSLIDILPADQTVYLKMDAQSTMSMMGRFLSGNNELEGMLGEAMDRTDLVLVSLHIVDGEERGFSLVASGAYPKGIIESRLNRDKAWSRKKGEFTYWQNDELALQLFFPERNVIAVSNVDVEGIYRRTGTGDRYSLPRELRHELDISDLVFFMPDPGREIVSSLGRGGKSYPIRMIWVTLYGGKKNPEGYTMSTVFLMDDEENALKFSKVARLLIAALMMREEVGDINALRENMEVYLDGNHVRLENIPVTREDLARFFTTTIAGSES